MARINHSAEARRKESKAKFLELMEFIKFNPEWTLAWDYIVTLETKLKDQEEDLNKYRQCFKAFSELLPKQYDSRTLIRE